MFIFLKFESKHPKIKTPKVTPQHPKSKTGQRLKNLNTHTQLANRHISNISYVYILFVKDIMNDPNEQLDKEATGQGLKEF